MKKKKKKKIPVSQGKLAKFFQSHGKSGKMAFFHEKVMKRSWKKDLKLN